jgi:hypothetical protein
MHHYVYKVEDLITKEFYIGSRTSNCEPSDDVLYKGSMNSWKISKDRKKSLHKTILRKDFIHRTDAVLYEAEEIRKVIQDPLNMNGTIPDGKYHTYGKVIVKDKNEQVFCVSINDPRYLSNELVSVNKGRKFTQSHKDKISWKGRSHTNESKEKARNSQLHIPRTHKSRAKPIIQYSLNKEFIKEWPSLTAASNTLNISCGNLSSVLSGKLNQTGGFKWSYKID